MTGAALVSMSFKSDLKEASHAAVAHEIAARVDSHTIRYTAELSGKLINNYLSNYSIKTLEIPPALSPAEWAANQVTPLEFQEWSRVTVCEEGGNWHGGAPDYDGLGESAKNWVDNGGQRFAPAGYEATPDEEIIEAELIQKDPPDQNGSCEPW